MSLFPMTLERISGRRAFVMAASALLVSLFMNACGAGYRPVVTPINPTGPAAQPTSFAVTISSPSPTAPGVATIINYSGDTIVAQANVGVGPLTFTVDQTGGTGYTVNSDGTLTNFPVSSALQAKNVVVSTLPSSADPNGMFAPAAGLWITDLNGNLTDVLSGSPATFKLSIPVAATPVAIIGAGSGGQRTYTIAQGAVASPVACNNAPTAGPVGEADSIEVSSNTVSARLPLGKCPVYAVQSTDARRLFVLNRGSDTVSVINVQDNTADACTPFLNQNGQTVNCHPTLPLSTTAVTATGITPPNGTTGMKASAGPVYAEYNVSTSQLVVADYDGATVSVIDVSLDEFGNDSQTFGTTFTIPVGANPSAVTALYDGSRAYTANQADGTVTVVNLISHTLEKTLAVIGHPRTVVSTQNSLFGKVYVASPDSPYLTIVRTDQDIVDATVLVQGNVIDVRTSTQNATQGNAIQTNRKPGYGQPCYLPGAANSASYSLCTTVP